MSDLTNESDMVLIKHFCLACNVYVTHIVQCTDLAFSITQFMKLIRPLFCQNYGKIWRKKVSYNQNRTLYKKIFQIESLKCYIFLGNFETAIAFGGGLVRGLEPNVV